MQALLGDDAASPCSIWLRRCRTGRTGGWPVPAANAATLVAAVTSSSAAAPCRRWMVLVEDGLGAWMLSKLTRREAQF